MYIISRVTLNFISAVPHREHVDVFIWTRAPQLIRLSTYALCMCALVINCHNLYARNSYFTLAILPAKEIISLGNACGPRCVCEWRGTQSDSKINRQTLHYMKNIVCLDRFKLELFLLRISIRQKFLNFVWVINNKKYTHIYTHFDEMRFSKNKFGHLFISEIVNSCNRIRNLKDFEIATVWIHSTKLKQNINNRCATLSKIN